MSIEHLGTSPSRHFGSHKKDKLNSEEPGKKVETVRYSPVNLTGQYKPVHRHSAISSLLQSTVPLFSNNDDTLHIECLLGKSG